MSCEEADRRGWISDNASRNNTGNEQSQEQWLDAQTAYRVTARQRGGSAQEREQDAATSLLLQALMAGRGRQLFRPGHMRGDMPSPQVMRGYAAFARQAILSGNVPIADLQAVINNPQVPISARIAATHLKAERLAHIAVQKQRTIAPRPPDVQPEGVVTEQVQPRARQLTDPMSQELFDGSGSVLWEEGVRDQMRNRTGLDLSAEQIIDLCGALSGSKVRVMLGRNDNDMPVIECVIRHPQIISAAYRNFLMDDEGKLVVQNERLHMQDDAPAGIGTRLVAQQVKAAKQLGASRIELYAAQKMGCNGYYTWPRMGFNAPIPPDLQEQLPEALHDCKTTNDLMLSDGGADWWRTHGTPLQVTLAFDNPNSMHVWNTYARAKGVAFADE